MSDRLHDIRILKLAEMYELAYERFILHIATTVIRDDALRRDLLKLAPSSDAHHDRIVQLLARLNAELDATEALAVEHAALLDVADVERAARDFYRAQAERATHPDVRRLLGDLAQEEEGHVRFAEDLLARARGPLLGHMRTFPLLTHPEAVAWGARGARRANPTDEG